jgi:GT2 family glycosyltransferase/glycosyltransferase involved in cell wall biosynthesis
MTTTCIVHGAIWPDALSVGRLRERLSAAFPNLQVLEARESADGPPVGAAAAINRAAAHATGDVLVIVEASVMPDVARLARLRERADAGVAIEADAHGRPRLEWPPTAVPDDLLAELAASGATPSANGSRDRAAPAWAIRRSIFAAAGGLDPRLGSVGYLEDLVARLARDAAAEAGAASQVVASEPLATTSADETRTAWPLDDRVAAFLRTRNRLITAFRTLDDDALGVELARSAVEQILMAWRRSGWHADDFRFGGDWGRRDTWVTRLLQPGRHGAERVADQEGVLAPLLALDAFLDEAPSLLAERRRRPARRDRRNEAVSVSATTAPDPATPTGSLADSASPAVSVIVVNWNGREHLDACFRSLLASDYPADRLELVCVDNGSSDGSIELLRHAFPTVRIVALTSNLGFTGGNEAGVAASRGDVLVFFNNDMRVAPDAISRLVAALDGGRACVAARVLSWDGQRIDFLRGSLSFEGRGFQDGYGEPANEARQTSADTFFANGGAFAVSRDAYRRAGGFDPSLFAYYDDVDLGWRLRLTGTSIRVEDGAIAWHRHGATGRTQPAGQKRFLMERNALTVLARCYGEAALRRTLGATLLLAVRRTLDETTFGSGPTLLARLAPWSRRLARRRLAAPSTGDVEAPPRRVLRGFAAESFAALGAALEDLPRLAATRAEAQGSRQTPDRDVLSHIGRTFEALSSASSYAPVHKALVEGLALPRLFNARTRLLIVSHEAIAANMSGPAVRFLELGRALSTVARVTVAMPGQPTMRDDRCTIAGFDPAAPATLQRLAEDSDVLFVQGFALVQYPFLTRLLLPIIVDLYCPFTIEHLEQTRGDAVRSQNAPDILAVQNAQLDAGDYFVCASEAQRDFWLGNLHSRGRINPLTYADDPTARRLIDVVPFGLPDERIDEAAERARRIAPLGAATATTAVMKGVRPGIGADDKVLLWAGSLLDWQDPLTLIRAVASLASRRPDVKLFFMGTKHPNPLVTPMRIVEECRILAGDLGVLDTHVFFNDWVPYDQRARYLVEADLGVSTHREHLETHFSFRTRMLDYVWAGLPIVCTRGDVFGDLVATRGLGISVPPGDAPGLADAIETMLSDGGRREQASLALRQLASEMRWSQVAAPLDAFCREPRHAPDHAPHLDALRRRLETKFKVSRWLKRTALRAGVSEMRVEQVKRLKAIRALMVLRNRIAIARARQ